MSVTIGEKKLKFHVLGNGFDNVRNDSGYGAKSYVADVYADWGMIDETNTYMWLHTGDGLKKYRIADFTEVEQTTIPTTCNMILHPSNVANNIGIAFDNSTDVYVFDLTDDTLIGTATGSVPYGAGFDSYDCILVGNKIYYTWLHLGRTYLDLGWIDLSDMSLGSSRLAGNVGTCGFINNSMIYACYPREWFYQTTTVYNFGFDGSTVWSNQQVDNNSDLSIWGITGNGKIYIPVKMDGAWHFGEFDGTSNPTFRPLTPIRTIGTFDGCPALDLSGHAYRVDAKYSDGKKTACLWTQQGLLYTDFHTIEKLDTVNAVPLAVSERYVICSDIDSFHNHKLYIYGI